MSRLLILTQTVDSTDSQLGFFHAWITALATYVDHIHVVCLKKGVCQLPATVTVHSLGKERVLEATGKRWMQMMKRLHYLCRFYSHIWRLRHEYDVVFVHMNQEYILLGGLLWRLLGKRIYFWRNHYAGNILTALACAFADRVFYTSRYSYTARCRRAQQMPVGVVFPSMECDATTIRRRNSLLFLARLDPSKRAEVFLDALGVLAKARRDFTATIVGGPSNPASTYPTELLRRVESLGIAECVRFVGPVTREETAVYYCTHELFVNCAQSGMLDKTIFEAAAAGAIVLASSNDFRDFAGDAYYFKDGDAMDLARQMMRLFDERDTWERHRAVLSDVAQAHALPVLMNRLAAAMELSHSG